jgi:tRNA 2-thiouridine synthesizing protein A
MEDETLDLRGLKCPLPALMARRALARLPSGTVLTILASDRLAVVDIPHMCGEEGHEVESVTSQKDHSVFRIRRATRPAGA